VGVALLGLYWWAAHFRLDPLDEGYFLYTSDRVYAGALPYRDFSTPYTPLFFYLNALLFRIFGRDVVVLRVSVALARLGLMLLMYLLGRRVMPPAFALLPLGMLFLEDQMPGVWETHPAWWATLALVSAVWCGCRYRESGRLRWWIAAGSCAALGAGFKQNLGFFTVAALLGLALVEQGELPPLSPPKPLAQLVGLLPSWLASGLARWAGPGYLLLLGLGVGWMMRAYLDGLLVALFVAPLLALGLERLVAARRAGKMEPTEARGRLAASVARLGLLGLLFGGLTLLWLVPLVLALGPAETPFAGFVGAIETAGYYWPVEELRPTVWPALGLVAVPTAAIWVLSRRWPGWWRAGLVGGLLALATFWAQSILRRSAEVHPSGFKAALLLSVQASGNLVLYLPLGAFWGAFWGLARGGETSGRAFNLRWLLLAGCLLELNQYPRLDETHLLFSGLLTWVAGAYALWRLQRWLLGGVTAARVAWSAALFLTLLALPLAAVWPSLDARRADLVLRQPGGARFEVPTYVWLGLPGLSVNEIDIFAEKYQRIAAYFDENSRPGERIFVYPAAPLFYYLLDRPNATRFNHFFPGLLSGADEDETIARLEETPASWVIWDSFGEGYWVTGRAYNRLTDYIWDAYEPVESIGGYEIMRRKSG
jgi:dolichyl-phosphate-mannose-protein mannosyltransferase